MNKIPKSLSNANIANKTVLVRVDFDVPFNNGSIIDDTKIRVAIPTIQLLLKNNCKVILLSHLGDPKGKQDDTLSLMDVRFVLGRLLEKQIKFANIAACENSIKFMDFGEVLLLENLRFSPFETSKKSEDRASYVEVLVKLADAYVFEAYGIDANVASVTGVAVKLPTYSGLHFEQEIATAKKLAELKAPITAVLGGSDIQNKIELLQVLVQKNNTLLLGGNLAYYFLKSMGVEVGDFEGDAKLLSKIEKIIKIAQKNKAEIVLPVDHITASSKDNKVHEITTQQITKGLTGMDIGPKTLVTFREILEGAKNVIWDGAMGNYTVEEFSKGTEAVGEYIALSTPKECFKVAIGSDVAQAMTLLKIKPKRFNFISLDRTLLTDFIQGKESDILALLSK